MILLNCQWLIYSLVETTFAGVNDYSPIIYASSFIILIDYTHGNLHQKRKFYDLEKMWCDPTEINEAIT